jgi:hypothetical protein
MSYFVTSDLTSGYWVKVKSAQVLLSRKVLALQLKCVLYLYRKSYRRIQTVLSDLTFTYWVKVYSHIYAYIEENNQFERFVLDTRAKSYGLIS